MKSLQKSHLKNLVCHANTINHFCCLFTEHVVQDFNISGCKKLKEGRWPELYFSSEQFPLNLRGTNGKTLN